MNKMMLTALVALIAIQKTAAVEMCLVRYDTNDTSVKLDLHGIDPAMLKGEPGAPGKRGAVGPPGPIGGSENDTVLRQRYDEKIAALEARLDAMSDPTWFLATNGLRYKLFKSGLTYYQAVELCKHNGGWLARVGMRHSPVKTQVVHALVENTGAWIGLDDLAHRKRWMWQDGVESNAGNTDWDTEHREPNNSGGNERCAHIRTDVSHGRFNDATCTNQHFALCERAI